MLVFKELRVMASSSRQLITFIITMRCRMDFSLMHMRDVLRALAKARQSISARSFQVALRGVNAVIIYSSVHSRLVRKATLTRKGKRSGIRLRGIRKSAAYRPQT